MKLSWLNTSEAYTNNTSIYMIWQYDAMLKVKERELESMDQTQTSRFVLRFEHTALRPRLHTEGSTIASIQDFPHREPPLRIWATITRSTQLLSPTNSTSTQEARHYNNHLSLEG